MLKNMRDEGSKVANVENLKARKKLQPRVCGMPHSRHTTSIHHDSPCKVVGVKLEGGGTEVEFAPTVTIIPL